MNQGGRGNTGRLTDGGGRGWGGGDSDGVVADSVTSQSDGSDPCGMCGRHSGRDAVGCDSCPLWFCPSAACTGLQATTLQCILNEGEDAFRFVCSSCRCSPQSSGSGGAGMVGSEALSQLFEMVKALLESETSANKCIALHPIGFGGYV